MSQKEITTPAKILGFYIAKGFFGRVSAVRGSVLGDSYKTNFTLPDKRYKLETNEGNLVDCGLYVALKNGSHDSSGSNNHSNMNYRSDTLVICCEGSGGQYQLLKRICTPLTAGYTVLGWDFPAHGSSTGLFYPDEVVSAADTVMLFALNILGYTADNIVLFGFSFGGFIASWLSHRYPNVKGVILDACPDKMSTLAEETQGILVTLLRSPFMEIVKAEFDYETMQHLAHYHGPVVIVRRLRDEIMHVSKGNLTDDLFEKLSRQRFLRNSTTRISHPHLKASTHLVDFDSDHCSSLPASVFDHFDKNTLKDEDIKNNIHLSC
jgi:pimeloyl-ACP methyl ester carboxylesterase